MNYFTDVNDLSQPIMPPDAEPVTPIQPVQEGEWKGLPVRALGDRIFLLKGGKKYWITSGEMYSKLGFKFGDEVKIDQATLDVIPEGEPIR